MWLEELLEEHLARMRRRSIGRNAHHTWLPCSVIVDNLDVVQPIGRPRETNAKLPVDSNTELAAPVSSEGLEVIAWGTRSASSETVAFNWSSLRRATDHSVLGQVRRAARESIPLKLSSVPRPPNDRITGRRGNARIDYNGYRYRASAHWVQRSLGRPRRGDSTCPRDCTGEI
jgi:hypothetical protein